MLRRKTPQADLENKRSTWRALGFVASLSLILSALAWTSYDVAITRAIDFEADLLEDEEIPVNVVTGATQRRGRAPGIQPGGDRSGWRECFGGRALRTAAGAVFG